MACNEDTCRINDKAQWAPAWRANAAVRVAVSASVHGRFYGIDPKPSLQMGAALHLVPDRERERDRREYR